jgi:hypothetical protein
MNLNLIFTAVNLAALIAIFFYVKNLADHYHSLTKNTSQKDLVQILNQIVKNQDKIFQKNEQIQGIIDQIQKNDQKHLQKIGFIRFNPFSDTGGNQSFCLCLLDENDSGLVISSLHSRENTRIYAKLIKEGSSPEQSLSKEEQEVLKVAQKS